MVMVINTNTGTGMRSVGTSMDMHPERSIRIRMERGMDMDMKSTDTVMMITTMDMGWIRMVIHMDMKGTVIICEVSFCTSWRYAFCPNSYFSA